ncbi:NYN domain-containing protein [Aeromonas caviae]|uniref:NYN domain-containing protein n=1 Tax=Aeromonas caviae TaxID=648 RepID=UPI002B48A8D8|nr:NYN domain-containing protein [Aeromonas caviae]
MSDEPSCSNDLDPQLPRCAWLLACSVSRKDASPQSSASARRIPGRILSGNGVHRFRNHCSISPEYANATDMALVIDVMDVIYTKHIDIICLVSSDCDFTPLVTRTLADGKFVIGFGERKAPLPFVNSCSRFLYLDAEPALEQPIQKQSKNIKGDTKLINLLRQAIDAIGEDDGWAMLGEIGNHISNHASFDQRNYGFRKLSDLFQSIDLFEMKKTNGSVIWVRDKRKAKQLNKSTTPLQSAASKN